MTLDETLNREADVYKLPTLEELAQCQNGKSDNILTGKPQSDILIYLYQESDYQMRFSLKDAKAKGYKVIDVSKEIRRGVPIHEITFPDGSKLYVNNFEP